MTILDTFITIYKADNEDLKRGHQEARKSTDEIVEGMRKSEVQAKRSSDAIGTFLKGALGWLTAVVSTGKLVSGAIDYTDDVVKLQQLSDVIGVNISQLDAFRRTITDSGGDASRSLGELQRLYRRVGAAARDSESQQAQMFERIGVAVKDSSGEVRDSLDIMLDMGDALRDLDRAEALDIARRLGVADPVTLDLMLKGRKEFEALLRDQKEQGVITKEGSERVARFNDALTRFTAGIRRGSDALYNALLPVLTWVTEKIASAIEWFNQNKVVVVGFFTTIATAVTAFFLPAMLKAAAATLAATWPFLLIGAAIGVAAAAIALIVDDIVAFMNGNDSLIGQISEEYPAIGRTVERLGEVFKTVWEAIGAILDWIGEHFGVQFNSMGDVVRGFVRLLLGTINQFLEFSEGVLGVFSDMYDGARDIFGRMWDFIKGIVDRIAGAVGSVTSAVKGVAGFFGIGSSEPEEAEQPIHDTVEYGSAAPTQPLSHGREQQETEEAEQPIYNTQEVDYTTRSIVDTDGLAEAVASMTAMEQTAHANDVVETAASDPLNAVTSNSIRNSVSTTSEQYLNIGEIKIETQATDSQGISRDISSSLEKQLSTLNAESASGVTR